MLAFEKAHHTLPVCILSTALRVVKFQFLRKIGETNKIQDSFYNLLFSFTIYFLLVLTSLSKTQFIQARERSILQ